MPRCWSDSLVANPIQVCETNLRRSRAHLPGAARLTTWGSRMNFCTSCGQRLPAPVTQFCTSCGASTATRIAGTSGNSSGTRPDGDVGNGDAQHATSRSSSSPPSRRVSSTASTKNLLAFFVIAILGVAGVVGIALGLAQKSPVAAPAATQQPTYRAVAPTPTSSGIPAAGPSPTSDADRGASPPAILGCQSSLQGGKQLALADTGDSVRALQWGLATLKYETYNGSGQLLPTTGTYDQQTANAVERFQRNHQLPVTGSVDRATWLAIDAQLHAWGSPAAC